MKALEKDRNRRYQTAGSFADDVRRYLTDEPIEARPPSTVYRLRKFVLRNKGPVAATCVITLSVLFGFIGASVGLIRATAEAKRTQRANEQLEATNTQLHETNQKLSQRLLHEAFASAMNGERDRTNYLLEMATQAGSTKSRNEFVLGLLEQVAGNAQQTVKHFTTAS